MVSITPDILQRISATCSGHAMKINITNATLEDVMAAMGDVPFRLADAGIPDALDDKLATIVTGCEDMSHTEFVCFVSAMDQLRFRNILIFPTQVWKTPVDQFAIPFWDRMGTIMEKKFRDRVSIMTLEGL